MTLAEAEATVKTLSHLIGFRLRDREVSNLAIMPEEKDLITEIANCLIDGENYKALLRQFSSFTIIVYYDLEDLLISGLLKWDYLESLMNKIGDHHASSSVDVNKVGSR